MTIRRAVPSDADRVTDLYLRARAAAAPVIPLPVHSDAEVRHWIAALVIPRTDAWLAAGDDGSLHGLLVLDDGWIEQLYVEPALTGRGIGTELVEVAKRESPGGLQLWTFEANRGARRFYERHGFVARERTDGDNEEGAPDVRYVWEGG